MHFYVFIIATSIIRKPDNWPETLLSVQAMLPCAHQELQGDLILGDAIGDGL